MTQVDFPLRAQVARVVAVTAAAWHVAPASPHALSRRAPHGHVPLRALRRLQQVATRALPAPRRFLAHSW